MTGGQSAARFRPLLAALSRQGAHLSRPDGSGERHGAWTVAANMAATRAGAGARAKAGKDTRFSAGTVASAVRLGYIEERSQGVYELSALGRAAYRRLRSGGGDTFCAQHRALAPKSIEQPGGARPVSVTVNLKESPLAWLASRKDRSGRPLLDEAQLRAGERLRSDFTFASLTPSLAKGWRTEKISGSSPGTGDLSTDVLAARKRVYRVLDKMPDALSRLVVDVCCHLKGLEDAEKERGWPARSAKVVLQIALTSLAEEYGDITRGPDRTRAPDRQPGPRQAGKGARS